ncbi:MAG TPA: hypothetical protein PKM44_06650, partial [Turneriella sp.]|nr:hypothetical protein [Turneriella sp.]
DWCIANFPGQPAMSHRLGARPYLLHYCYGDARFDKRRFWRQIDAEQRLWTAPPVDGATPGSAHGSAHDVI